VTVPDRLAVTALSEVLRGRLTPTSYQPAAGLDYDEWLDLVAVLGSMQSGCLWWIGDAILFGERKYGETFSQAEEATGLDPGTLSNVCAVCDRIEKPRRRVALSFSHHAEVCYLDERVADRLLDEAEANGWSRSRLRDAKRRLSAGAPGPREPAQLELGGEPAAGATDAGVEVCECCGRPMPDHEATR
jgi:hypothetical protein